jgi:hypothetical protein
MLLRFLYGDLAANNVIANPIELSGLNADKIFDCGGVANLPETHLHRQLHR